MKTKKRLAIDLFSGCGGLTQGLKEAGFNVVACAEIRPEARDAYKMNHPNVDIFEDIRLLESSDLLEKIKLKPGQLDLLAACPPCQGFSSIRTRNRQVAEDDERNSLIFEVLRLCIDLRPKCILIENVPKLLNDWRLKRFIDTLGCEYTFNGSIVNAQDCGVPQRRKRMILLGSLYGPIDFQPPKMKKRTVADAIGDLPAPDSNHKRPLHRIRQNLSPLVQRRLEAVKKDRSELPPELVLKCHRDYPEGFKDVYGRMSWDDVSPTITRSSHNPSKGRYVHPDQNRGLTLYESMLLQAFPRSYKFPLDAGIGKISSMIGEAIPPPFGKIHGEAIFKHLCKFDEEQKHPTTRPNA